MYINHEEADSRMFFHVSCLAENSSSTSDVNIVVRSTDTDSLITTIGCFQKLLQKHQKLRFWLKMGLETKNTVRHVHVNQIYLSLGQLLSSALSYFHALFGCDYTEAFSRKGKVHPFQMSRKYSKSLMCILKSSC